MKIEYIWIGIMLCFLRYIDKHNFHFQVLSDGDKVKNWLEEKEAEQKK